MKKLLAVILLLCMLPVVSLADSHDAAPENQYTFWLRSGVDRSLYPDYGDNAGVQWLESVPWGEEGKYIDLDFYIPVSGSETDNFNTLLATEEYMDVMDMSAYSGSALELYYDGIVLDITDYVEQYMPNYLAFLDANPKLKATSTVEIDGERRYIQIRKYEDDVNYMWGGFVYRRDWIVKYGKNPFDGSSFSGEFIAKNKDGSTNLHSWNDNVVFPSGNRHPIYISDWEWMFEIFTVAMEDLGITDGYCMSLYYPGYLETGDIVSAFGGGGAHWYLTPENKIEFGATGEGFRAYLQCMNTWYKRGWIDKTFNERTTDMFFEIDMSSIYSGKVGLWYNYISTVGASLADPNNPYLDGFIGYAAPQPINDVYGSEAVQGIEPYSMYQVTQEGTAFVVTDKAKNKDLATLFTALDYLYSPEGAVMQSYGLNGEQYELTQNEYYQRMGITGGAYKEVIGDDGRTMYDVEDVVSEGNEFAAVRPERLPGLNLVNRTQDNDGGDENPILDEMRKLWIKYRNTGWLTDSFVDQLSIDDYADVSKIETRIKEFLTKNVPTFIKGTRDPFNDNDWDAFVKAINKYKPEKATQIYQDLADRMYGN